MHEFQDSFLSPISRKNVADIFLQPREADVKVREQLIDASSAIDGLRRELQDLYKLLLAILRANGGVMTIPNECYRELEKTDAVEHVVDDRTGQIAVVLRQM